MKKYGVKQDHIQQDQMLMNVKIYKKLGNKYQN